MGEGGQGINPFPLHGIKYNNVHVNNFVVKYEDQEGVFL